MSKEMLEAFAVLEEKKGIKKDLIVEAIKAALVAAYKKNYNQAQNVEVEFNDKTGNFKVVAVKTVVDEVQDDRLEISLADALAINRAYEVGDEIRFEVTPKNFGRIAAQTAKQVIMQRLREAERNHIIEEYSQYQDELITGTVERRDNRFVYVTIGNVEAVMPAHDQMPNETYNPQDQVKVIVTHVGTDSKGAQIVVSRTAPDLVKRLFEQEVPEIYDGVVEIMSIAREAGDRSKVAVRSRDKNIDPVGTCVGQRGQRVQTIVNELNGENMDIIEWAEEPTEFIRNAMNPADVVEVIFDEANHSCIVVVPDYQLSLAIGKKGQNARLAARLTTYKIDIKSETAYADYLDEQAALAFKAEEDAIDYGEEIDLSNVEGEFLSAEAEVEAMIDEADNAEQNFDAEDVEELVAEAEVDPEQSYDELVEEVDFIEEVEEEEL